MEILCRFFKHMGKRATADKLYTSSKWARVRRAYLAKQNYICERCGRPAVVVHHRNYLTAQNMNDPNVTLNFDNLEALCLECHAREHIARDKQERRGYFDGDGNYILDCGSDSES